MVCKYDLPKFARPRGDLVFTGKPKGTKPGHIVKIFKTGTGRYYLQLVYAVNGRQFRLEPLLADDVHYYIEQNS